MCRNTHQKDFSSCYIIKRRRTYTKVINMGWYFFFFPIHIYGWQSKLFPIYEKLSKAFYPFCNKYNFSSISWIANINILTKLQMKIVGSIQQKMTLKTYELCKSSMYTGTYQICPKWLPICGIWGVGPPIFVGWEVIIYGH